MMKMSKHASGYWNSDGYELMDWELEELFDDYINEVDDVVVVMGQGYDPAEVLKECDPTAYRCHMNDWIDFELQDGRLFESDPLEEEADED